MTGSERLLLEDSSAERRKLTHYMFRYPAKFHPPVVRALLNRYTNTGDCVLDPFAGSGTLLVEAAVHSRIATGIDIDPVAVTIALAKTRRYDRQLIENAAKELLARLEGLERPAASYNALMHNDISREEADDIVDSEKLAIPAIPNLLHWFRRYVVIDLARIKKAIDQHVPDAQARLLLHAVFASIIRNASNADPVPVSGLEYTSYMQKRDAAGRLVNPYALFRGALVKSIAAVKEWLELLPGPVPEPCVFQGSALALPAGVPLRVDAVITSPPYHNAVDYYRRHQLEMFWLGHTRAQSDRLELLPHYIGRPKIAHKNPLLAEPWDPSSLADEWERKIRDQSVARALDFRHYVQAMTRVFSALADRLQPGAPAVFVLGHSRWNGETIPTDGLFTELARPSFELHEVLSYPVKNRYMSYSRRNAASIDAEYVLVLRRT